MAIGAFTADAGPPPLRAVLDPILWLFYAFVGLVGAFAAASAVLAWRNARQSPRWLLGTLLGLIMLSLQPASEFLREKREMERFLATADSTQGVVINKYVRGGVHLVVEHDVLGQSYRVTRTGASPMLGTPAFSRWHTGDTIPVYYQPRAPRSVLVGERGPDRRALFESLAKVWIIWGVLLTAYLPMAARALRRSPEGTAQPAAPPG